MAKTKNTCIPTGTFVAEDDNDVIAYGLVHPLNSWDSMYTQFCHWKYMVGIAWEAPTLSHKLSIFLKGPGWVPGKGRLGDVNDIPDVSVAQVLLKIWFNSIDNSFFPNKSYTCMKHYVKCLHTTSSSTQLTFNSLQQMDFCDIKWYL